MTTSHVLLAAGAPRDWCHAIMRRTDVDLVEVGLRAVCASAVAVPQLVGEPLTGRSLTELTDDLEPSQHAMSDTYDRAVLRNRADLPAEPGAHTDARAPAPRATLRPKSARPPAGRGARRAAAATTITTFSDAAERAPTGVPHLVHVSPRPQTVAPTPGSTPMPLPDNGSAPIEFATRVGAAVAARLQIREPRRLADVFATVPAPGPGATAELIEQVGSGHVRSAAPGVSLRRRPGRHTSTGHERAQRSRGPDVDASEGGVAAQHMSSATNGAFNTAHEETGRDAPESTAMPTVSAPAVDPTTGAVQLGAVPGEQPRPHQIRPATQRNDETRATRSRPAPIPDADLERAMRRVLDDAARRHGIEV